LSFKSLRPALRRRTILGTSAALAAAAAGGNLFAYAQDDGGNGLPDAADAIQQTPLAAAPDLHFTDATGRKLSLADFRGSGLVVNIWATWCGPCVAEFPTLAALAPQLRPAKILVLPISIDFEGRRAVQPFYATHDIHTLPILLDPNGTTTDALNTDGVPFTIIVTAGGQIAAHSIGAANWNTSRTIALITQLAAPRPQATNPIQPV
jgi:thiol-disulfide isomerase/thioredoxin